MDQLLRMLIVDDSKDDAMLLADMLQRGGYKVIYEIVDTPDAMRAALPHQVWDVITSEHAMPHFSAQAALALARELRPDLPFIIVSGEIDLNLAVLLMKEGAHDCIQKRELSRVVPAIERELREAAVRRNLEELQRARNASETRYRRLFETALDGILILDAETGVIDDVNPFLMNMLGYSHEYFEGKQLWEIGAFKDIEASKAVFAELQRTGNVRYENLPLKAGDGHDISVEFISNVYTVDDLRVIQCNIRDITERKQHDDEIRRLNVDLEQRVRMRTAQLEELNKELEAFSTSVSHDLRAPLRHINGLVQMLHQEYEQVLTGSGLEFMKRIRAATKRMDTLIEALLALARFSYGALRPQKVDLSALFRSIADEVRQNDPTRRAEFHITDGIVAVGDPDLLRIVLENLLSNAWKFTASQALTRIDFGVAPQPDGHVAYFVRDNGVGFDMALVHKLFGTFQRLHRQTEFPGTGIGLATVQRIIHRHSGRAWAESAVNQGATFYWTLGSSTEIRSIVTPTR